MTEKTTSDSKDDAYFDRNQAILLAAKLAQQQGYIVGIAKDPKEPDWPVVMLDLPTGQVGWHISKKELTLQLPDYQKAWDGHNLKDKRQRLQNFLEQNTKS